MILSHNILENHYIYLYKLNQKSNKNFSTFGKFRNSSLLANIHLGKLSNELLYSKMNYNLKVRSFWRKFVNQYWQETIFISNSDSRSEVYIHQLKAIGLSIHKGNDYKKFLLNFSKALINGDIEVKMKNCIGLSDESFSISSFTTNNNKYIKLIWRKGINKQIALLNSKYLFIKNNLFNQAYEQNLKNVKIDSLPIFAITNNYNQIIMAESPEQILLQKNLFYAFSQFYNQFLSINSHLTKSYIGLLFINPQDAYEYKEYIENRHENSSRSNQLKFFIGNLTLYRDLMFKSLDCVNFRLIPDLREISKLTQKYQYYSNIILDNGQNCGKYHFQGQPIYLIRPIYAMNKNTNKKELVHYFYNIKDKHNLIPCKAIFLNYKTVLVAWNKFRQEYNYYSLPIKPPVSVSNLETLIKDKDYMNRNQKLDFIFIPSKETYQEILKQKQRTDKNSFQRKVINKSIYIKKTLERIIWSLTSRQPIYW